MVITARKPRFAPSRVFRVCAVCGQRHAPTYGFRRTLAAHGIKGDKAAVKCIRTLHLTHPIKS